MSDVKHDMTPEQHAIMLLGSRLAQLENALLNLSQVLAEKEHGVETVRAACAAAGADLGKFASDPHPYDSVVQWHQATGTH
jgi:hypothetical protein